MPNYFETKCEVCGTLVGVSETKQYMPYRSEETAECPVCGTMVYHHNSRGDFESKVVSLDETKEPYKSEYLKEH